MFKKTLLAAVSAAVTSIAALPAYSYDVLSSLSGVTYGSQQYDLVLVTLDLSDADVLQVAQSTPWFLEWNGMNNGDAVRELEPFVKTSIGFSMGDSNGDAVLDPLPVGNTFGPKFLYGMATDRIKYVEYYVYKDPDNTEYPNFGFNNQLTPSTATDIVLVLDSANYDLLPVQETAVVVDPTVAPSKSLRPVKYTLAPDLIPSNVPTCSGSKFVSGVQVLGNGGIQWFVENSKKDECFNVDVTVLPEGVSAKDMSAVMAALGSSNFDVYALR